MNGPGEGWELFELSEVNHLRIKIGHNRSQNIKTKSAITKPKCQCTIDPFAPTRPHCKIMIDVTQTTKNVR